MTEPLPQEEQHATLAAGYALGLLSGRDLAEALHLVETDGAFAGIVARWEAEVDRWLDEEQEGAEPSSDVWQRIAASVGPVAVSPLRALPGRGRQEGWRLAALAASLVAVCFASLWLVAKRPAADIRPSSERPAPKEFSVAQIEGGNDTRLVAAVYDRSSGRLMARISPLETKGGVPELWLIGSDGKPRSLGMVMAGDAITITLPPEARKAFVNGATIAISIEPSASGSHDAPKGPVLGTAKISEI